MTSNRKPRISFEPTEEQWANKLLPKSLTKTEKVN